MFDIDKKTVGELRKEKKIHLFVIAVDSSKMTEQGAATRIADKLKDMIDQKVICQMWIVE